MFWILVAAWVILGGIGLGVLNLSDDPNNSEKTSKLFWNIAWVFIGLGAIPALCLLLAGLGWLWYHLAGGFLVIEVAESLFDYIFYGLLSAFGLLFIFGALWLAAKL